MAMNKKEQILWQVTLAMAQKGYTEMMLRLKSENRWRAENGLPSVEEELQAVPTAPMEQSSVREKSKTYLSKLTTEQLDDMLDLVDAGAELGFSILNSVQTKCEWKEQMRSMIGEELKEATGFIDPEVDLFLDDLWGVPYVNEGQEKRIGEWAAERGVTAEEYSTSKSSSGDAIEDSSNESDSTKLPTQKPKVEQKETMKLVVLHKESYPEVTLWAVVPQEEWLKTSRSTAGILNLVEKQVTGQTFPEAIAEAEKDVLLRTQGVPDSLRWKLERLTEALEEARLSVEDALPEDKPMTVEELTREENYLLRPQENPIWDYTL